MKLKLLTLLTFVNTLLIIVLSLKVINLPPNNTDQNLINTPTSAPSPSLAKWQTYTDEKWGFSFNYPTTWKINKNDSGTVTIAFDKLYAEIFFDPTNKYQITQPINKWLEQENLKISKIKNPKAPLRAHSLVNDNDMFPSDLGVVVTDNDWFNAFGFNYFIPVKNTVYTISTSYNNSLTEKEIGEIESDIKQILTTFKVIGSNTISTPSLDASLSTNNDITFSQIKTLPHSNSSSAQLGYLNKVYEKDNKYFIEIDYIDWIDDNNAPNGFRISNQNSQIRTFELSLTPTLTCLNPADLSINLEMNPDQLIKLIEKKDGFCWDTNLFRIDFDNTGKVSWMTQVYTP
jgi:hypothetical protein